MLLTNHYHWGGECRRKVELGMIWSQLACCWALSVKSVRDLGRSRKKTQRILGKRRYNSSPLKQCCLLMKCQDLFLLNLFIFFASLCFRWSSAWFSKELNTRNWDQILKSSSHSELRFCVVLFLGYCSTRLEIWKKSSPSWKWSFSNTDTWRIRAIPDFQH